MRRTVLVFRPSAIYCASETCTFPNVRKTSLNTCVASHNYCGATGRLGEAVSDGVTEVAEARGCSAPVTAQG